MHVCKPMRSSVEPRRRYHVRGRGRDANSDDTSFLIDRASCSSLDDDNHHFQELFTTHPDLWAGQRTSSLGGFSVALVEGDVCSSVVD
ncbi:uncharacterized protein N7498_010258 [Penicillium cinerascens]|uniref:Uncharacterized protein n=1 Tax=Penicillium cinerascens TaxID=70096 RepID=A0A9W9M715_9EURO|nr:uncharacterized protein N7498_010258 [Penicillium cinerascens]KAJ5191273.1 hypothetical protein N7498_010258 [Penicillium cinerascens]